MPENTTDDVVKTRLRAGKAKDRDHDWIAIVAAAMVMTAIGGLFVLPGFSPLLVLVWVAVVGALVGVVPLAFWRLSNLDPIETEE